MGWNKLLSSMVAPLTEVLYADQTQARFQLGIMKQFILGVLKGPVVAM